MNCGTGYISPELTHFVGRGKTSDEQYALLMSIVRSGWLSHPPHRPFKEQRFRANARGLPSENEMYEPSAVCFCDIPVGEMELHMSKYSQFGLAFSKAFLLRQGATPVNYVAADALVPKRRQPGLTVQVERIHVRDLSNIPDEGERLIEGEWEWKERGVVMDEELSKKWALYAERRAFINDETLPEPVKEHLRQSMRLDVSWDVLVFSLMKVFRATSEASNERHYYMEREWRVFNNVEFRLADIARIILPADYAPALKQDLPDFLGEIQCV